MPYGNDLPEDDEFAKEPPLLPPFLRQIILNSASPDPHDPLQVSNYPILPQIYVPHSFASAVAFPNARYSEPLILHSDKGWVNGASVNSTLSQEVRIAGLVAAISYLWYTFILCRFVTTVFYTMMPVSMALSAQSSVALAAVHQTVAAQGQGMPMQVASMHPVQPAHQRYTTSNIGMQPTGPAGGQTYAAAAPRGDFETLSDNESVSRFRTDSLLTSKRMRPEAHSDAFPERSLADSRPIGDSSSHMPTPAGDWATAAGHRAGAGFEHTGNVAKVGRGIDVQEYAKAMALAVADAEAKRW